MKNSVFWEIDKRIAEVSRDPAWAKFHRECGDRGIFFVIERDGVRSWPEKYTATAVRYEKMGSQYYREIDIATVTSDCPRQSAIDAFHAARASKDEVAVLLPVSLVAGLEPEPVQTLASIGLDELSEIGL